MNWRNHVLDGLTYTVAPLGENDGSMYAATAMPLVDAITGKR